jgi:DNA transformation protein and related proteins
VATQDSTVAYLLDQMADVPGISARKMFGEYGLFLDGKTVGLICNDQLFIKITDAGRALAPDVGEMPAYRGAKPSLHIEADSWEDRDWLSALVKTTADALPVPKPKKRAPPKKT